MKRGGIWGTSSCAWARNSTCTRQTVEWLSQQMVVFKLHQPELVDWPL